MQHSELNQLCEAGNSFYDRGYAFGSTGNLSVRLEEDIWITPTGSSLKGLTPNELARIDLNGQRVNSASPSKEYPFHLAIYRVRATAAAVVHLHSTYSVALSCLDNLDEQNPLPIFTPYYLMRVAPLAVLPYFHPGSSELGDAVGKAAEKHECFLLRNHGLITFGATVNEAVDRAEELEETARLYFLLRNQPLRPLTTAQAEELRKAFPRKG